MKSNFIASICILSFIFGNSWLTSSSVISNDFTATRYGVKVLQESVEIKNKFSDEDKKLFLRNSTINIQKNTMIMKSFIKAQQVINELSAKIDLKLVSDFFVTAERINRKYETHFVKYYLNNDEYNPWTIENFVNTVIRGERNELKKSLHQIRRFIVPKYNSQSVKDKKLFQILLDYYKLTVRLLNNQNFIEYQQIILFCSS